MRAVHLYPLDRQVRRFLFSNVALNCPEKTVWASVSIYEQSLVGKACWCVVVNTFAWDSHLSIRIKKPKRVNRRMDAAPEKLFPEVQAEGKVYVDAFRTDTGRA